MYPSNAADIRRLVNPARKGAIYHPGCHPASLVQLVVDAGGRRRREPAGDQPSRYRAA